MDAVELVTEPPSRDSVGWPDSPEAPVETGQGGCMCRTLAAHTRVGGAEVNCVLAGLPLRTMGARKDWTPATSTLYQYCTGTGAGKGGSTVALEAGTGRGAQPVLIQSNTGVFTQAESNQTGWEATQSGGEATPKTVS